MNKRQRETAFHCFVLTVFIGTFIFEPTPSGAVKCLGAGVVAALWGWFVDLVWGLFIKP